jgi:transcriptional regulator with XRE-family HTH domain
VGGERVSRWELGRSQPRPDLLVRMAEVLNLHPRQLVRPASSVPDLRALRLAAGLDAFEVVDAIHLSLPTYRRWERGQWSRLPSSNTMVALAQVLKATRSEVEQAFRSARDQQPKRTHPGHPSSPPQLD